MKGYRCAIVLVLASVVGAWTWTAAARAEDDVPLTMEEKADLAAKRKEELHNKQMKGLFACIAAVCFVSLLFWALNNYNKVRKQRVVVERREAVPEDDVPMRYSRPETPLSLEPPAGDW